MERIGLPFLIQISSCTPQVLSPPIKKKKFISNQNEENGLKLTITKNHVKQSPKNDLRKKAP